MHKRFLATTFLSTALLFSQGGSFLLAALCPHLRSGMASCELQLAQHPVSHEDMAHEDMGDMSRMEMEHEPASNPNPSTIALDQPIGSCPHCAVHSRTIPNTASLRDTEPAKRSVDLNIPLEFSRVAPVAASPVSVLTSRAHGPPGGHASRHILLNIFRI